MILKRNIFLATLFIFSAFNICCIAPVLFEGRSMQPTLNDGDRIFINYTIGDLNRGEIIKFQYPRDKSKYFVKRIIGLPNETVEVKNGITFINGKELQESYLGENSNLSKPNYKLVTVPENHYYVMGDNRENSSDSRLWGTVSRDLIEGKYLYKYLEAKD